MRERRARARRADGPELRPGRRLSAAAGVDRGPARGRPRADRPLDRVARRLQLPRPPPVRGRGQGGDRGAELRPDDRRAARGQGRDRAGAAERGRPRPRPARVHPGGRARAAPDLHDSDLPEPVGAHALARAASRARRARAGQGAAHLRGRPVPPRPLLRRGPAEHVRAGRRQGSRVLDVVLEDRGPGASHRLHDPAPRAGQGRSRRSRRRCTSARRRFRRRCCTSSSSAASSSRISPSSAICSASVATPCWRAWRRSSPRAQSGAIPTAATSSGSTCRRA